MEEKILKYTQAVSPLGNPKRNNPFRQLKGQICADFRCRPVDIIVDVHTLFSNMGCIFGFVAS